MSRPDPGGRRRRLARRPTAPTDREVEVADHPPPALRRLEPAEGQARARRVASRGGDPGGARGDRLPRAARALAGRGPLPEELRRRARARRSSTTGRCGRSAARSAPAARSTRCAGCRSTRRARQITRASDRDVLERFAQRPAMTGSVLLRAPRERRQPREVERRRPPAPARRDGRGAGRGAGAAAVALRGRRDPVGRLRPLRRDGAAAERVDRRRGRGGRRCSRRTGFPATSTRRWS